MRDFLIAQRKEEKAMKKTKSKKGKHKNETPEERRARKERKKMKKMKKSAGVRGVEELLNEFEGRYGEVGGGRHDSPPLRRRSTSRERLRRDEDESKTQRFSLDRRDRSTSRTPPRRLSYKSRSPPRGSKRSERRIDSPSYDRDRTPPRRGH